MKKINILDSTVFNRIAAGEVVENPRSVVKEIVENSIDAGADSISIEIRGGGISYISVADNGIGMTKEDMPTAFLPHATSKIKSLKDLEAITTLGFRGEALPSIASVADVDMISRPENCDMGYEISLRGGRIVSEGECGASFGTKIIVSNLFSNIPARSKFLRKPQMEESSVTELIIKIILANPNIKIKYSVDGVLAYQSDGNGIESAVYNVYGSKFFGSLAPVDLSMPGIELHGLIGKPNFSKHNRTYQTLIVNGRFVINSDISYCVQQCYRDYLMKRQFPVYVLYLNLPPDMVDVNVHPNKLDVKFAGEKRLKGIIYNAIKQKIDNLAVIPSDISSDFKSTPSIQDGKSDKILQDDMSAFYIKPRFGDSIKIGEESIIRTSFLSESINNPSPNGSIIGESVKKSGHDISPRESSLRKEMLSASETLTLRYAGKLFNTYIFAERGNDFYIIDQHAAHEKLLYDKLIKQIDESELVLQDMLVPYIFDVSPSERVALIENLTEINNCGFKIEPLSGNSFSLYALPVPCAEINLDKFVSILLSDISTVKKVSSFVKESVMQAACKSAVKGEMDLSESEILSLISQLEQSGATKFCPHGRPIIVRGEISDLEKIFKRI